MSDREQREYRIRLAQQGDAFALAEVHHSSLAQTFGEMLPEYANSRTLDDFRRLWQQRLEAPTCVTSVMTCGDQIVGLVSAAASRDDDADGTFGDVDRIYLHPSAWEKGLGVQLLTWCEEELVRMGFMTAKLWVFEVNERARRFYERNGYVHDGKTKEDFNARLLRYGKKLGEA
jgi:GNAT superfamily N-acetyltransferase